MTEGHLDSWRIDTAVPIGIETPRAATSHPEYKNLLILIFIQKAVQSNALVFFLGAQPDSDTPSNPSIVVFPANLDHHRVMDSCTQIRWRRIGPVGQPRRKINHRPRAVRGLRTPCRILGTRRQR